MNYNTQKKIVQILHIDDDDTYLYLIKRMMSKTSKNIVLHSTNSPVKAVNLIKKFNYDLVVSDYNMPELDGISFYQKMISLGFRFPFVILSGENMKKIKKIFDFCIIKVIEKGANVKDACFRIIEFIDSCLDSQFPFSCS